MDSASPLLADLAARGLVQDCSDLRALDARLAGGPVVLYCGFDPTADSLHVGNLLTLLGLRRFQLHGHRPIALAGGTTGLIGDPSGRTEERALLDEDALASNLERIRGQIDRFLDFSAGPAQALLLDNSAWLGELRLASFLRDVGKHVTVGTMLHKQSVRSRLDRDSGLSFTEFSYMLLQAQDFRHLCEAHGCELQVGGSDQWGNITVGLELIRKTLGRTAHGLTWPLLVKADGTKFGKTSHGNIWLAADRTSPYQFFQFFVRTEDADVDGLLRKLTLLPVPEIEVLVHEHLARPEHRLAQQALARQLTTLVHGEAATATAEAASRVLFARSDPKREPAATFEMLRAEVPHFEVPAPEEGRHLHLSDLFARSGLAASRSEAHRLLAHRGAYVNGGQESEDRPVAPGDLLHRRYVLLRRGKSSWALGTVRGLSAE